LTIQPQPPKIVGFIGRRCGFRASNNCTAKVMKSNILVVEDDEAFVNALRLAFRNQGVEIHWAANAAGGISAYRQKVHGFASVIIDYSLPDQKGSDVARTIRKLNPGQDILFASGHRDPDFLIDLLETGAARTFLPKGLPMEEIKSRVLDSIALWENRGRVLGPDEYVPSKAELELRSAGFVGRSAGLYGVLQKIERYRESPYPTLITGETGVGKELVAQALAPKGKTLITINCARFAQSENLLESELFGHVKGAFTGANADKAGLLTRAHGHAIFFDELHELPLSAQAKLLRVLEDMRFRRVGDDSGREISIETRVIAATKPDIRDRIKNKLFLEDLYHRVAQLEIMVPPLRERPDDIEPLVRHFQDEFNASKGPLDRKQFRISTVQEMARHPWTGNVRELKSFVRRLLTDCRSDIVNPADFQALLAEGGKAPAAAINLASSVENLEATEIRKALQSCRTLNEAATRLGLTRWSLNRKLERLGIDPQPLLSSANK
jgi:DNA-binding NtrC family response regulator